MKKYIKLRLIVLIAMFFVAGCTNLDEELFNKISPENFYSSPDDVFAGIARVYEHTSWALHSDGPTWRINELSADHFVWTQKGRHGYDQARWIQLHGHSWNYDNADVWETWRGLYQGVGYAYNLLRDVENVLKPNAEKFNISEADMEILGAEMMVLSGIYHMTLMENFGNVIPIFRPDDPGDALLEPSTGNEVFEFIEGVFKDNLSKLGKHVAGSQDEYYGRIDQATCAAYLARLYLNAGVTTGTERYADCATYCQNIINGDYGSYSLDDSWQLQFNYNNDLSRSIIFAFPGQKNQLRRTTLPCNNHYKAANFFRSEQGNGCNGTHVQPSQTTDGRFFEDMYGQGSPYQKFYDGDERRVPHFVKNDGTRQGIFVIGSQSVPGETYGSAAAFDWATEEWKLTENADTIYCVDRVGRFSDIVNSWRANDDPRLQGLINAHNFEYVLENATQSELASINTDLATPGQGVTKGEENSGFRQEKYPIYPDVFEEGGWNWNADFAVIRLTEIYYMLAETKLRGGDVPGAAALLDQVRGKYFTQIGADEAATRKLRFDNGEIADPREPPRSWYDATTQTGDVASLWAQASYVQNQGALDLDEMLDEWGREFMGEGYRRMTLRRFDKFTKGRWWNKNVDTPSKSELFPIPKRALNANNKLVQNHSDYQSL
jgi:hypothetical protein